MHLRFTTTNTPLGIAAAVFSDTGLRALTFSAHEPVGPLWVDDTIVDRDDDGLGAARAQLAEYFTRRRRTFDLPVDLSSVRGFARKALETILTIPYGETASYGDVAVLAGAPGAARAVGTACARTPISVVVPVHRVVRADGTIGEYGGRTEAKRFLLDLERYDS